MCLRATIFDFIACGAGIFWAREYTFAILDLATGENWGGKNLPREKAPSASTPYRSSIQLQPKMAAFKIRFIERSVPK